MGEWQDITIESSFSCPGRVGEERERQRARWACRRRGRRGRRNAKSIVVVLWLDGEIEALSMLIDGDTKVTFGMR